MTDDEITTALETLRDVIEYAIQVDDGAHPGEDPERGLAAVDIISAEVARLRTERDEALAALLVRRGRRFNPELVHHRGFVHSVDVRCPKC